MSKYINADELMAYLEREMNGDLKKMSNEAHFTLGLLLATEAADVEKVRHGKWIFDKNGYIACSCCDFRAYAEYKHIDFDHLNKYCPHCGAKMDGE